MSQQPETITLYRDGRSLVVLVADLEGYIAEGWCEVPLVPLSPESGTDPAPRHGISGATSPQCEIELNGK